jgi:hypothetical protein
MDGLNMSDLFARMQLKQSLNRAGFMLATQLIPILLSTKNDVDKYTAVWMMFHSFNVDSDIKRKDIYKALSKGLKKTVKQRCKVMYDAKPDQDVVMELTTYIELYLMWLADMLSLYHTVTVDEVTYEIKKLKSKFPNRYSTIISTEVL